MRTEKSPPYHAHLSLGQWYVINSRGGYELACDSRDQAVDYAAAMSLQKELIATQTKEKS